LAREDEKATLQTDEAQRILKQVEHDSQSLLLGGMPSHGSSGDENGDVLDGAEVWGRRIGRTLAIVLALVILIWFLFAPAGA
jgi:hypothetical protein